MIVTMMTRVVSRAKPLRAAFSTCSAKPRVLVIAGPTASGKSAVAVSLAEKLNGEVINADSVQMYKELVVGANRVSEAQRKSIPHHLLGHIESFEEPYSVADFLRDARSKISDVLERGKVPIVVGGSAMYLRWLVHGKPDTAAADQGLRQLVAARYIGRPFEEVKQELDRMLGPDERRNGYLEKRKLNPRHLSRAIELVLMGSHSAPPPHEFKSPDELEYDFRCVFLSPNRVLLNRNIDLRCENMVANGLLNEVAYLRKFGLQLGVHQAAVAIGYRDSLELLEHLRPVEDPDRDEMEFYVFLSSYQAHTRQLSRRQMQWYRDEPLFRWVTMSTTPPCPTELCDDYPEWNGRPVSNERSQKKSRLARLARTYRLFHPASYTFNLDLAVSHILDRVWSPAKVDPSEIEASRPTSFEVPEGWNPRRVERSLKSYSPRLFVFDNAQVGRALMAALRDFLCYMDSQVPDPPLHEEAERR